MNCARTFVLVCLTGSFICGCRPRPADDPGKVDLPRDAAEGGGSGGNGTTREVATSGTGASGTVDAGREPPGTAGAGAIAGGGGGAVTAVAAAGGAGVMADPLPRSPTFVLGWNYAFAARGSAASPTQVADLNGDGKLDVAFALSSGGARVLLGKGDGSFVTTVDYPPDPLPLTSALAIGDLNGDGKPDLAMTNQGILVSQAGTVSLLINNGDGTFVSSASYPVGQRPSSIAIGDVNGDGKADLAATNQGTGEVSVLLNTGNGGFAQATAYPAGGFPNSIVMADLNGDARPELVIATQSGVNVLMNRRDGSFAAPVNYAPGIPWLSVAVADLNGDGKADLALAGNVGVSVHLNRGDGTFPTTAAYSTGNAPVSVAIADVNGDGNADLAVANRSSADVSVLLNKGDGTFAPPVSYFDPGESVALGDLTGDGRADLIVATSAAISVVPNRGDGTFLAPIVYAAGVVPQSITVGDIDGDGQSDWAVANIFAGDVSVVLNQGHGLFAKAVTYPTGPGATAVALGTIDEDNRMDIAVANSGGVPAGISSNAGAGSVSVLFGNGGGTFERALNLAAGVAPSAIALGDLNGDGRVDLAIANQGSGGMAGNGGAAAGVPGSTRGSASVILSSGNRTFATAVDYAVGASPRAIAVGDLDGDGKLDVAVANHGDGILGRPDVMVLDHGDVSVLLNQGNGTLGTAVHYPAGRGLTAMVLVDLNGDGKPDLALANQSSDSVVGYPGGVTVLLNKGDGTFATPVVYPSGDFGPTTLASGDLNGDGNIDLIGGGTGVGMDTLLNDGKGGFSVSINHFLSGTGLSVGDLNGDGKPDLALAIAGGACVVLNNTP